MARPEAIAISCRLLEMVRAVKALGLETCCDARHAEGRPGQTLKEAGLDYYNHNLDTAPEFYGEIIRTRDYQDRLDTLERVRERRACDVCCGGIVGMGESRRQRAGLIAQLAKLDPIRNRCRSITSCRSKARRCAAIPRRVALDPFEFVRTIAVGAHRDAARDRAAVGRAATNSGERCRRCVSSPARTRSSTATSC